MREKTDPFTEIYTSTCMLAHLKAMRGLGLIVPGSEWWALSDGQSGMMTIVNDSAFTRIDGLKMRDEDRL